MAPTVGAVSRSIGVCLATDLRGLRVCSEFKGLGTLLPLKLPPLSPGQAAALAVVENDKDGMEEACDSTALPMSSASGGRAIAGTFTQLTM